MTTATVSLVQSDSYTLLFLYVCRHFYFIDPTKFSSTERSMSPLDNTGLPIILAPPALMTYIGRSGK